MNEKTANDESLTATVGAALLGSVGKGLNGWSMLLALAAILIVYLKPGSGYTTIFLVVSLIAGLAQGYFALRCAFDTAIFTALGENSEQYQVFDQLLTRWKVRGTHINLRTLEERVQGAMRLLRSQAYSFCVQVFLLVASLI